MRNIHHLWLTVYCKPEDNEKDVTDSFLKFFPFDLEKEKLRIDVDIVDIQEDRKIKIFRLHLHKTKHLNQFMKNLNSLLTDDQKRLIIKQRESRLDSDNHFFIRSDKDKLIKENELFITDEGNCYHLKISIAAFPTTRENALRVVEEIFG